MSAATTKQRARRSTQNSPVQLLKKELNKARKQARTAALAVKKIKKQMALKLKAERAQARKRVADAKKAAKSSSASARKKGGRKTSASSRRTASSPSRKKSSSKRSGKRSTKPSAVKSASPRRKHSKHNLANLINTIF